MNKQTQIVYAYCQVKADTLYYLKTAKLSVKNHFFVTAWLSRYEEYALTGEKPKLIVDAKRRKLWKLL